jgi:hypothetical protein
MEVQGEPGIAPQPADPNTTPSTPDPHEVDVHGLTARFFLNRPIEDLIPVRFLMQAERHRKFACFSIRMDPSQSTSC